MHAEFWPSFKASIITGFFYYRIRHNLSYTPKIHTKPKTASYSERKWLDWKTYSRFLKVHFVLTFSSLFRLININQTLVINGNF